MPIKQSVCYECFNKQGLPLGQLFREIRGIGYQAIEFCYRDQVGDYEEVIRTAHENGLVVASISGHKSLTEGLNDPGQHERIEKELRESIDIAARHRIPGLIGFSGFRRGGQSDAEGLAASARCLRRVAPYAEQKGVNLNIELISSRGDLPGYQCDHSDWGAALCEWVGSERVRILFDIFHMQIMEGNIIDTIRRHIRHIGHFHTAGNPGRHDLDDDQELNYRGICRAIAATGYNLYVGHEFLPQGDAIESLRRTFELCNTG